MSLREKPLLLGKAPTHVPEEELISYFLYAFEFAWNSPAFETRKNQLAPYFIQEAQSLVPAYDQLSLSKKWWLYVMIALRDITHDNDIKFGKETILYVIRQIERLSEEELELYVNDMQNAFYEEVPDILVIRPLELERLQNSILDEDPYLGFFLEQKEPILKVMKKYLKQKDVDKEYINHLTLNDKTILAKYTDFWNVYFEIFTNFFLSMYDFQMPYEKEDGVEEKDVVEEMIMIFFIASVNSKTKIEELTSELLEVILPIMEKSDNNEQSL